MTEQDRNCDVFGTSSDAAGGDGVYGRLAILVDRDGVVGTEHANESSNGAVVHGFLGGLEGDDDLAFSAMDGNAALLFEFEVDSHAKEEGHDAGEGLPSAMVLHVISVTEDNNAIGESDLIEVSRVIVVA